MGLCKRVGRSGLKAPADRRRQTQSHEDVKSRGIRNVTAKASREVLAIVALLTLLATLALPVASADAYNLLGTGCRYDPDNDDDGLGIGFDRNGSFYDSTEELSIQYAASAWNNAMTPQFTIVDYGSSTRDLRVQWDELGQNVGGRLSYSCGSDHYRRDPVFRWGADATYYTSTLGRRMAIAIHEIGHSYGLHHSNTGGCGSSASLMYSDVVDKYDDCGWDAPRSDSISGATAAHDGDW